jgi:hypothetical protein
MTKVQVRFALARKLEPRELRRAAEAHSIYGMARVVPAEALDELVVDYDASRLSPAEVEAALRGLGLPVRRKD